ncbi:MAG: COX15/CtaA family protein, partial [Thermoleophilia bacterium]|nr:COX15/CtaA family protein [Thermoleophilia bacterium]
MSAQTGPSAIPTGFRRLAWAAVVVVFLLIVLGGVVRVSDSGLGCGPGGSGLHGWPLCNGRLVPGLDLNHILEYSHRVVASTSGLIIFALVIWAWRRLRANKTILRLTGAAAALVLFEGVLGGATVEYDLDETLVATHLGIAMIILGLLLANARVASGKLTLGEWPT